MRASQKTRSMRRGARAAAEVVATIALVLAAATRVAGQPYGLSAREANTEHYITGDPPDAPAYEFVPAFAGTPFYHPQDIVPANDGSGRIFVTGQANTIWVFEGTDPPGEPQVFLHTDHPTIMADGAQEEGFMSLALHPDFANNGYFYVSYSWFVGTRSNSNRHNGIWRFQAVPPSSNTVDPATGVVVYEFTPTNTQHLGGGLRFGNDGYLYCSYGFGMYPGNLGYMEGITALDNLIGKVIRLDVDNPDPGKEYSVPASNPWVGTAVAKEEIYARGFRNPWKMTVDPPTGHILIGDVGGALHEEIDRLQSGRHFGYPYREGVACHTFLYPGCSGHPMYPTDIPFTNPVFDVLHADPVMPTSAICLGPVYRGDKFPELEGAVLWADFVSGHFSMMRYSGFTATEAVVLARPNLNISSIAADENGDIWVADWFGGGLFKLKRSLPASGFPYFLSEAPWLIDLAKGDGAEGVLPYDVIAPLWSDGAFKTRYLALPELEQIGYRAENSYEFPTDTMFMKNFWLEAEQSNPTSRRLIETRLMIRRETMWEGYSYEWNEGESDAQLLPAGGKTRSWEMTTDDGTTSQSWTYPSRSACFQCHTAVKNTILGFETLQVNRDFAFAEGVDNQLRTFEHIGLFEGGLTTPPLLLEALPDPSDSMYTFEERSRSYLHANCAMCHQPGGPTPIVDLDLRWGTPLEETGLVGVTPTAAQGDLGVPGALRITEGNPHASVLYLRMKAEGASAFKMPPLARELQDLQAARAVFAWIARLGDGVLGAEPGWLEAE